MGIRGITGEPVQRQCLSNAFFELEMSESINSYKLRHLIPELEHIADECRTSISIENISNERIKNNFKLLQNELFKLNFNRPLPFTVNLTIDKFSDYHYLETIRFLEKQKAYLENNLNKLKAFKRKTNKQTGNSIRRN